MYETSGYLDRLAEQQIAERLGAGRPAPPMRHRPRGRRALAHRLRHLADRLDG